MKLKNLKLFELHEIQTAIAKDSRYVYSDWWHLARIFLEHISGESLFNLNTNELRLKYIELGGNDHAPIDSRDFLVYLCKRYLEIDTLPKDLFFNFYDKATKDYKEIIAKIENYNEQIAILDKEINSNNSEEANYKRYLLLHYRDMLKEAQHEVTEFVMYNLKSKSKVSAIHNPFRMLALNIPYSYAFLPELKYDAERLSDLGNKFTELSPKEHKKLKDLFKSNSKEFLDFSNEYIQKENIIDKIFLMVDSHHILNQRKNILSETLDSFTQKKLLIFIHIIPLQVEGIFHDYCIALGDSPEKLLRESLNDKLKRIRGKTDRMTHYEYYAFRFPLTRNKVAHGRYLGESAELTATMLILDLFDVCKQITSHSIFQNKLISFYKNLNIEAVSLEELINCAIVYDITIPSFYNLKDKLNEIYLRFQTPEFWNYLNLNADKIEESKAIILRLFAKKFRSQLRDKNQADNFITLIEDRLKDDVDLTLMPEEVFD